MLRRFFFYYVLGNNGFFFNYKYGIIFLQAVSAVNVQTSLGSFKLLPRILFLYLLLRYLSHSFVIFTSLLFHLSLAFLAQDIKENKLLEKLKVIPGKNSKI